MAQMNVDDLGGLRSDPSTEVRDITTLRAYLPGSNFDLSLTEEQCLREFHRQQDLFTKHFILRKLLTFLEHGTRQNSHDLREIVCAAKHNLELFEIYSLDLLQLLRDILPADFNKKAQPSTELIPIEYMNLLLPIRTQRFISISLMDHGILPDAIRRIKRSFSDLKCNYSLSTKIHGYELLARACIKIKDNSFLFETIEERKNYSENVLELAKSYIRVGMLVTFHKLLVNPLTENDLTGGRADIGKEVYHARTSTFEVLYDFNARMSFLILKPSTCTCDVELAEEKVKCYIHMGEFDPAQDVLDKLVNEYFLLEESIRGKYSNSIDHLIARINSEKNGDELKHEADLCVKEGRLEDALSIQKRRKFQTKSAYVLIDSCCAIAALYEKQTLYSTEEHIIDNAFDVLEDLLPSIKDLIDTYFSNDKRVYTLFRKFPSELRTRSYVRNTNNEYEQYILCNPSLLRHQLYNRYSNGVLIDQLENYGLAVNFGEFGSFSTTEKFEKKFIFTTYVYTQSFCIFIFDENSVVGMHLPKALQNQYISWEPFLKRVKSIFKDSKEIKIHSFGWKGNKNTLKSCVKGPGCCYNNKITIESEVLPEAGFFQYVGIHVDSQRPVRLFVPYSINANVSKANVHPKRANTPSDKVLYQSWERFLNFKTTGSLPTEQCGDLVLKEAIGESFSFNYITDIDNYLGSRNQD